MRYLTDNQRARLRQYAEITRRLDECETNRRQLRGEPAPYPELEEEPWPIDARGPVNVIEPPDPWALASERFRAERRRRLRIVAGVVAVLLIGAGVVLIGGAL